MPRISPTPASDPVSEHIFRSQRARGAHPVPLISTSYDITISGGLADVSARRIFRNEEKDTIEATLTFPLPVHAVLHGLEAKIGGRTLRAVAKAKAAARENYEDAIDRGKTAVLHEELLKGVHQISVAHVAPGTEIEVTAQFAMALAWLDGRAFLRIPLTVGDVYGASGLLDCDDLKHGGAQQAATVRVACDSGSASVIGADMKDGAARVWLNAPINVEVNDWTPRALPGRAADGKAVTLTIEPAKGADAALDVAILVDHSGSMNEPCGSAARMTKHAAVLLGLTEAYDELRDGDRLNLWQFDDKADDLGAASRGNWREALRNLEPPHGGTEIGGAIATLLARRKPRDVLLVTDGKSHALDVQKLAASGARFNVVLIGDDSLEANVGHLAALTGGEIFAPDGARVTAAVRGALKSMRGQAAATADAASGARVGALRSGMAISATWGESAQADAGSRAAVAYATALKLPRLTSSEAAALAEAEGLVTHLTSLVLVDEEGATQTCLPATRKVELPEPAPVRLMLSIAPMRSCADVPDGTRYQYSRSMDLRRPSSVTVECAKMESGNSSRRSHAAPTVGFAPPSRSDAPSDDDRRGAPPSRSAPPEPPNAISLTALAGVIDWRAEGRNLADANMIGLPPHIADEIDIAARDPAIVRAAKRFGLTPRALVIALIARFDGKSDRHADRTARAILRKVGMKDVQGIADEVGLGRTTRASA